MSAKLSLICGRMFSAASSNIRVDALARAVDGSPLAFEIVEADPPEASLVVVGVLISSCDVGEPPLRVEGGALASARECLARVGEPLWIRLGSAFIDPDQCYQAPVTDAFWLVSPDDTIDGVAAVGHPGSRAEALESDDQWLGHRGYDPNGDAPGIIGRRVAGARRRASPMLDPDPSDEPLYLIARAPLDGEPWPPIPDLETLLELLAADISGDGFRGAHPGMPLDQVVARVGTPAHASVDREGQQSVSYQSLVHHPELGERDHLTMEVMFVGYDGPVATISIRVEYHGPGGGADFSRFVNGVRGVLSERFTPNGDDRWGSETTPVATIGLSESAAELTLEFSGA